MYQSDRFVITWVFPKLQRLKRDPVLSNEQGGCVIHPLRGGSQEMICLPLELIPGWLFGVSSARVKPELQGKIIRYQRECFRVLWQTFQANTLSIAEKPVQTAPLTGLAQIREMVK